MKYHFERRNLPLTATLIGHLSSIPHIHPHLELVYLASGSSIANIDGASHRMEPGDILLTFPNQIHYYHDLAPIQGCLIIVSADYFADLNEYFNSRIPVSPVIKSHLLPENIGIQIERIHQQVNSQESLEQTAAKGNLLAMLAMLIQKMRLEPCEGTHDSFQSILLYCLEHYTEPLTLDSLSSQLHLRKYYISHIFTERLRISFPEFINSLRVEYACSLLKKEKNITQAAYAAGFNSIRSFSRNFKKITHMTPSEFLRK